MPLCAILALIPSLATAGPYTYVAGKVRIQVLSNTLVRLEELGPHGFEDRKTFTVVNRNFAKPVVTMTDLQDKVIIKTESLDVFAIKNAQSLREVAVVDPDGKPLFQYTGTLPQNGFLPSPGKMPASWVLADSPRLIPPAWGATPAPPSVDADLASTSGWDTHSNASDVYVFATSNGYNQFRKEFLDLTGPIPKPPLYALGFIDSRYFPYSEAQALESIDTYRQKQIPLDTFVVDTDWRINGSAGYDVEPKYFPDMPKFIKEAHSRHAHLMFNDHPDPKTPGALDPKELEFRWNGLSKLLNWGLDIWWYDRNWSTHLKEPMPGIKAEMWGQRLFHDMTEKARPNERPWIMTNAEGIDNGIANYAPEPAGHRFPMMWTGDTGSQFSYLRRGVENGVDRGVNSLQPYVHEDLGGHTGPTPSPELYVRYLEYGCLSPITRVHCTLGQDRHPWAFGAEAEKIASDYIKFRYHLLPSLYSAAQRAVDDGTPLLGRCDLYWPEEAEASHSDQYLLSENLLVAPIITSVFGELKPIPAEMLHTADGDAGLTAEYFDNANLQGKPKTSKVDAGIDFDWSGHAPLPGLPQENFSVRWTGVLGPVPDSGTYKIVTKNDDGIRVWIDGKLLIDDWKAEDGTSQTATVGFEARTIHSIRVEYMQLTGDALCTVGWIPPTAVGDGLSHRQVWIPPGTWQNLWTGERLKGPQSISVSAKLSETPMWAFIGGIVFSGPDMQYTGEKAIDPITTDIFVGPHSVGNKELDEDDGLSNDYIRGDVARTKVSVLSDENQSSIILGATKGTYKGIRTDRNWIVRIHLAKENSADTVFLDGKPVKAEMMPRGPIEMPLGAVAAPQEGDVLILRVPASSIRKEHHITVSFKG